MRKASTELSQSRGLKRRPLLRTSSPLKPRINRELTLRLVQQTGARQRHDDLLTIPWMALSIDSMCFVSSTHATLATGV